MLKQLKYFQSVVRFGSVSTARSRPFRRGIPTAASPSRTAAMGSCATC